MLAEGYSVIAVDNLLTGRMSNIEHLRSECVSSSSSSISAGRFEFGEVDYVFHFASPASPVDYMSTAIETLQVGSLGTHATPRHRAEISREVLMASTSECYGDPLEHPQKETYWGT